MGAQTDIGRGFGGRPTGTFSSTDGLLMLRAGILAGPIAWALDLLVSYALVKWSCGHQHMSVLHLVTIGSLIVVGTGAFASWHALQEAPGGGSMDGGRPFERAKFMAALGLAMSALFAIVVIAGAIPRWAIDACL